MAVNGINYSISQSHTYDNGGRKTKTEVSFDNILNKNIEETTAFDALDKPLQTKIGGNLQTLDYEYFAGGFLDKVNGGTTGAGGLALTANGWPSENSSNDLFAMDLDYLANGNISNWKQQNRGFALQNYTYTYDDLQRITNATDGTFHQAYSYKDALGNFNGIFRNDLVKTNGNWALQNIDDNAYFYGNPLSSKISSILDYTGSQLGYKANSGTYAYDANGNTTYDPANKLTTLYNYLNLPSKFTKDDGSKQELVYDFSGNKWQEIEFLVNGDTLSKRSYLGSFEFERNSLQKAFHSTGFIQNLAAAVNSGGQSNGNIIGSNIVSTQKLINGGKSEYIADKSICLLPGFESLPVFNAEIKPLAGFQWNYILKDHLGNTRILFTDKNNDSFVKHDTDESQNEVLSVSNFSPFGLELGGSQQNLKHQFDYKFNSKQDNGFSGFTDFGARWLDKSLSVWTTIDPSVEKYFPIGSRVFAINQPTKYIDPDGREIDVTGMDVYSQVQLALSLSRITGNNISIQAGKIINKGKVTEEGSPKASSFLDYLIGSSQVMYANSTYSEGSFNRPIKNKDGDLITSVFLNPYQIEETLNSFGETQGWGLTFLHEALHTGWASYFIDKNVDMGYEDPPKPDKIDHDPNALGETERVVNEFRKELKFVEKSSYFHVVHKTSDGVPINVTWKFGGVDKEIKPINRMLIFDKIIRLEFSKNLR